MISHEYILIEYQHAVDDTYFYYLFCGVKC